MQRTLPVLFLTRTACVALAACASVALAAAQVTVQLGAGGGVRMPIADDGGTTEDFFAGTKYGLSTGYNLLVKARAAIGTVPIVAQVDYGVMSNSGTATQGQGKLEVSQTAVALKLGSEYQISIPASAVTPYLGANLALNFLRGKSVMQGVPGISSGTYTMSPATRLGVGFSGGIQVGFGPTQLDVGLEYNLVNPFSKSFTSVASATREDSYQYLNDGKDPAAAPNNIEHFISERRSINTLVLSVCVLFHL